MWDHDDQDTCSVCVRRILPSRTSLKGHTVRGNPIFYVQDASRFSIAAPPMQVKEDDIVRSTICPSCIDSDDRYTWWMPRRLLRSTIGQHAVLYSTSDPVNCTIGFVHMISPQKIIMVQAECSTPPPEGKHNLRAVTWLLTIYSRTCDWYIIRSCPKLSSITPPSL